KQAVNIMNHLLAKMSKMVVYTISMVLISWQLTAISVMLFALVSVGISTLIKKVREVSFAITKANGSYTSAALELVNGMRTIQGSVAQDFERRRFNRVNYRLREADRRSAFYSASIEPTTEAASTTILISMLLFSFYFLIPNGRLQISSLLTFMFVLFQFIPLARFINGARSRLSNLQGSIENIKQLLATADKPYLSNGSLVFTGLERAITLEQVDFAYESNSPILRNITLTIEQGKVTALVGSSGAGKSTLADLIPRFYDPTGGRILFDGHNLEDFDIDSIRQRMAIVSQDTFIFNTSVRENIAYGLDRVAESEIVQAAKLANAWEFIRDLPDGFDTELGDRGTRLSGGQRQRIAIARALLRNPDILILDEATSALDSVSEKLIQQSLEKLSQGRTVITIAHRLSTIAKADRVVVLEGGEIVEQGTYQQLLQQKGKLWRYHQMQYQLDQAS
ncbi:MAG: ATP-binding cassette domain-containing protein, partial [Cyanobacteria bacterium J06623_7]